MYKKKRNNPADLEAQLELASKENIKPKNYIKLKGINGDNLLQEIDRLLDLIDQELNLSAKQKAIVKFNLIEAQFYYQQFLKNNKKSDLWFSYCNLQYCIAKTNLCESLTKNSLFKPILTAYAQAPKKTLLKERKKRSNRFIFFQGNNVFEKVPLLNKATKKRTRDVQTPLTIEALPDEILILIINLLPIRHIGDLSSVNHRFNSLAQDSALWESIEKRRFFGQANYLAYCKKNPLLITQSAKIRLQNYAQTLKIRQPYEHKFFYERHRNSHGCLLASLMVLGCLLGIGYAIYLTVHISEGKYDQVSSSHSSHDPGANDALLYIFLFSLLPFSFAFTAVCGWFICCVGCCAVDSLYNATKNKMIAFNNPKPLVLDYDDIEEGNEVSKRTDKEGSLKIN